MVWIGDGHAVGRRRITVLAVSIAFYLTDGVAARACEKWVVIVQSDRGRVRISRFDKMGRHLGSAKAADRFHRPRLPAYLWSSRSPAPQGRMKSGCPHPTPTGREAGTLVWPLPGEKPGGPVDITVTTGSSVAVDETSDVDETLVALASSPQANKVAARR